MLNSRWSFLLVE